MSIKSWLKKHTTLLDGPILFRFRDYEHPEWENTSDGDHILNVKEIIEGIENDRQRNQESMYILSRRITNAFEYVTTAMAAHELVFHTKTPLEEVRQRHYPGRKKK